MKHLKQAIVMVAMIIALALVSDAQITVPHTFTTSVPVSQLNTNLSTIADGALKRNGGNITGPITVDSGVTIDTVDISAALGGSGTGAFATVTTSNVGAASIDAAGGITAGTSNVGIIGTDGRIPAISPAYFASLSGANLTGVPSTTGVTVTSNSISFAAGNYTAGGTQTWTVDAGDSAIATYMKIGTFMFLNLYVTNTDVGGAANAELRYTVPCTISGNFTGTIAFLDAGTAGNGVWLANSGTTTLSFYKDGTVAAPWTGTTGDNTQVRVAAAFNCTT